MKHALVLTTAISALLMGAPATLAATAKPAAVTVAPVQYDYRVLPNGLKIYLVRDARAPNVAIQVWYEVGSKDDPVGRSGFAHLFEHMMFKATHNLPAESFDRMTEDVGGYNNASTNDDFTNYFEVAPANYLKTLLWAEAERMGGLVVDDANFKSERDVVKEELRQRILAQPYGRLFGLDFSEASFDVSPYGRPGIGSIENLDAATVQEVQAFHAAYYRPDNAVMVIAGDFDTKAVNGWIDQYFGPIKRPSDPIPRVTATEPVRQAPKVINDYAPNVPLPAVAISYPFPPASSPDLPALIVADAILSKGESSRLYSDLVYKQELAQQTFSDLELREQPGAYAVGAILSEGKSPQQGETALRDEVARMRDQRVTPAELAEAKNQLITDTLRQRETAAGEAEELANAAVIYGDASKINRLVSDIQKVTPADVQRVSRKYLVDAHSAVIRYEADTRKPANAQALTPAATIRAQALPQPSDLRLVTAAPEAERVKPPAPGAPVAAPAVETAERTLPNGLRVIVAPMHGVPIVSAEMTVGQGAASDPANLPGDAEMAATLMTKGTASRSAEDIARQIESLGGEIGAGAGYDGSTLSLVIKRDELEPAMTIFADVARNPAFAPEELDRARQQALNQVDVAMKNPGQLANLAAARAVYGTAPYGEPAAGTLTSLKKLTRDDMARFHAAAWRPDDAVLVLTGDLTPEQGFALAEKLFGDWAKPAAPKQAVADPAGVPQTPQIIVIDLPNSGQAAVVVTRRAIARSDPRYYQAVVANSLLGGGYSSRLNEEIRVKRGLSYGASSNIGFRKAPGPLIASTQTKNESAAQVVDLVIGEMQKLGLTQPTPGELTARKAAVVGNFGRTVETSEQMAAMVSNFELNHVPLTEIGRYADHVTAVTGPDVQTVGAQLFDPAAADIVVVGDAKIFLDALRAKHPDLIVIRAADVDLDDPTLRKSH